MTENNSKSTRFVPFGEALHLFVPAELWDEYDRAASEAAAEPRRPSYWGMGVREWRDAMEVYSSRSDLRARARAKAEIALSRIVAHLIERLVAGELTGVVQDDPPFGPWRAIPSLSWRSLEPVDIEAGHFRAGNTQLRFVHVVEGRYETLVDIVSSGPEPKSQPPRTGAPGQPSSMYLIKREWEERHARGKIESSRKEQAGVLRNWLISEHPEMPPPTEKTIYNQLPAGVWAPGPKKGGAQSTSDKKNSGHPSGHKVSN